MRLTILGGGGFRVPFVHQALLHGRSVAKVDEIVLHDTDTDRLDAIVHVIDQLPGTGYSPRLRTTTSLDDAVRGTDFVFAAIRVGGTAARIRDERVALGLGVLGQETVGPGGIAFGLRTIPVMVEIAQRIAELAPSAYVMNFTNPAGMITEAMQSVLGDRVLGICDTPSDLGRRVARAVGADGAPLQLDYVGLNHLGWMRRVLRDGEDLLPALLADDARLGSMEEAKVFGSGWLRALGVLPNEYLYYYYRNREAVRRILEAPATRGEFLDGQQTALFARILTDPDRAAALWSGAVATRSSSYMAEARHAKLFPVPGSPPVDLDAPPVVVAEPGPARAVDPWPDASDLADHGYAGVALQVMGAIAHDRPTRIILNVRNGTTVAGLPPDAVIEVPSFVDANGAHPLATAAPDLHQLGLMQQVKDVERATIRAALTGSRVDARLAFALHPLVHSLDVAEQLVDGYIAAVPEIAAVLHR